MSDSRSGVVLALAVLLALPTFLLVNGSFNPRDDEFRLQGRDGTPTEKSYGMSWWKSLAALERWAESHPTHVAIFGAARKYLSALGPAAKLKLYHEVTALRADEQRFEYLNCHEGTGLLRAVALPA